MQLSYIEKNDFSRVKQIIQIDFQFNLSLRIYLKEKPGDLCYGFKKKPLTQGPPFQDNVDFQVSFHND